MTPMSDDLWRDTAPLRAPQSAGRVRPPRPWLALWVLAAVAVVVGVASVFGPVVWFAATYGCDSEDTAYAQQLAASEVLDLFPPGAQAVGGRDTCCEDDDEMAMASQDYRRGQLTREEVLAFYEQSLTAAGWLPSTETKTPGCWNRQFGDRGVSLSVDQDSDPDHFTVELSSASRKGGGGWCS